MKAWQKDLEIIKNAEPCYLADDNEIYWEEEQSGPEEASDIITKIHWHSQVPGSRAHESICLAAIQATENKGMIVEGGMELIEKGYKAYDDNDMVAMHQIEQDVFYACYNAKKDANSSYWNQTFYDTFEDYAKAVDLSEKVDVDIENSFDKFYAGWLGQIIGGAYGTCIEGYRGSAIKRKYNGEVTKYVRKPNTYNDDITYELCLILAYKEKGKDTTAKDIAREWLARIPSGWSAEEWALNNLKVGILPPESGRFHNPFNEWIGAQMRGAVCGQIYPGNLYMAAKAAFEDASISHNRNGILAEVFNALLCSMAFYEKDTRTIVEKCIKLIPDDSEYGKVIRDALDACYKYDNYFDAWMSLEEKYERYNWIHAYPNAIVEVIAMYYGENDFTKTLSICGGCGQDVDCNAAQISTILGTIIGSEGIPNYWKEPFGDVLNTYVRGIKVMSIKELAKDTQDIAKTLK